MVVAEKKYYYGMPEIDHQQLEQKNTKKSKKPKSYRLEKLLIFSTIFIVLGASLLLLLRYTKIIEARYALHSLNNQLEQLDVQTQKTRIEVEKVTKSRFVESQAKTRLNMTYPKSEQTIYINVNQMEVAEISSHLKNRFNNVQIEKADKKLFTQFLSKLQL